MIKNYDKQLYSFTIQHSQFTIIRVMQTFFNLIFILLSACRIPDNQINKKENNNPEKIISKIDTTNTKDTISQKVFKIRDLMKQIALSYKKNQKLTSLKSLKERAILGQDSIKIVCFGNSITYGFWVGTASQATLQVAKQVDKPYPQELAVMFGLKYPKILLEVVNEGHNGWRSDQALTNFDNLISPKKPHLLILKFGINDAYSGFTQAMLKKNLTEIIKKAKKEKILVLLLTPTPTNTPQNAIIAGYVPIIKAVAKEQKVYFLDTHQAIINKMKEKKLSLAQILPDKVHFDSQYYEWIAEAVFDFIEKND